MVIAIPQGCMAFDKEIEAYKAFVETKLKPDYEHLKALIKSNERKAREYACLREKAVEMIGASAQDPEKPLRVPVDLGYGYSTELHVYDKDYVFVEVGFGFYCQMTWQEASCFCTHKEALLKRKHSHFSKKLDSVRRHVEMTQKVISQLNK